MPRVDVDIDSDLYNRLKLHIARTRGSLYAQQSDVIEEAIKKYLDRNERKISRGAHFKIIL
jgi:metal-responsive CopG/Arc/MetJ family transcriptional regulator